MKIILTVDDSLTVGASIEDEPSPNPAQCMALRDLAIMAGEYRQHLLGIKNVGEDHGF